MADAARKARAQQKNEPASQPRSYTNDDVASLKGDISVVGPSRAAAPRRRHRDSGCDAKLRAKAPVKRMRPTGGRNLPTRAQTLADDTKELDVLQREFNLKQTAILQRPECRAARAVQPQGSGQHASQNRRQEAGRRQRQQAISDLEDELRKSGGEPGWANENRSRHRNGTRNQRNRRSPNSGLLRLNMPAAVTESARHSNDERQRSRRLNATIGSCEQLRVARAPACSPDAEIALFAHTSVCPHDVARIRGRTESMEPLLLVEDKAELRAMLRKALERAGYAVDEAADGSTAVAKVRARRYLLVLTDLKLPGCSGLDVLARIEAGRPDHSRHPDHRVWLDRRSRHGHEGRRL